MQLIDYLNIQMKENAFIELDITELDMENFKKTQNKWQNGELDFNSAMNDIHFF